mgnify:CR=1 FL=1
MNLSWLDDFLALAATGNFSRAADERHMTQPAFSRRIRALEEWLGTELFDRSSQPARLTDAGKWFSGAAQALLAHVARIPGEACAVADAAGATLRFAATHALSFSFLPGWLRELESHTAARPISLESDVLPRCEALLLQGKVQFVLSHAHPQVQGLLQAASYPSALIGQDLLLPVSRPDPQGLPLHALVGANPTTVQMLSYSTESGIGGILRGVCGPALDRMKIQVVFTAHLASVLRTMVLDGRGMAWLPQTLIGPDLERGRLVAAAPAQWNVALEIRLYREPSPIGQAAQAFWQAVCRQRLDPNP